MFGRLRETQALRVVLDAARHGSGSGIVVRGPAGIGKTTLLKHLAQGADDAMVLWCVGVQAESELPYAGLQRLTSMLLDHVSDLPPPQQKALRVALGLVDGDPPRPMLIGLALRGLLAAATDNKPVLCLVDDVQWIDGSSVQALGFAARRLTDTQAAVMISQRSGHLVDPLEGLPVLELGGVAPRSARELVRATAARPLDDAVTDRMIVEAHGNPLLLQEAVRAYISDAVESGLADPAISVEARLERSYAARLNKLPASTVAAVLVAAADPTGDPRLVVRAARRLGAGLDDFVPAEREGLLRIGRHIVFTHPLVRSGVYRAAPATERRNAHAALAAATDGERDPDRRAWHRAQATLGPAESVAADLERSAARAGARGGFLAAAAFYERAAELAERDETAARCALAAAAALDVAGFPERALRALDLADTEAQRTRNTSPLTRARVDFTRGRILLTLERSSHAAELLLRAAAGLHAFDAPAAREAYLEALSTATLAAPGDAGTGILPVARAARSVVADNTDPMTSDPPTIVDLMLDALTSLALDPPPMAVGRVREILPRLAHAPSSTLARARWGWVAARTAAIAWQQDHWAEQVEGALQVARGSGAILGVAAALTGGVPLRLLRGDVEGAMADAAEAAGLWHDASIPQAHYGPVAAAAWRGHDDCDDLFTRALTDATARGEGMTTALVAWAQALHGNATGRYSEAAQHAEKAARYPWTLLYAPWATIELVEAAARSGDRERARAAAERIHAATAAAGTAWAMGIQARCDALAAADDDHAESAYRRSIDQLTQTPFHAETARSRLVFGEWLRRRRRRGEARKQLQEAVDIFTAMGARAFANRATAELTAATGTSPAHPFGLSAQEYAVSQLAGQGLSNAEIALQLHVSPSTVDYHLRKAFRKLGITSRTRLHLALTGNTAALPPKTDTRE